MLATHQLRAGAAGAARRRRRPRRRRRAAVARGAGARPAPFTMGTSTEPWALDNERPAHARRPAGVRDRHRTRSPTAQYAEFIAAGGYDDPRWWSAAGWRTASRRGWSRRGSGSATATGTWYRRRFGVRRAGAAPTSRWCTCAATRPTPTRRGRASGCPPRRSGRRPPASTRPPAARRRYPWGDEDPTPEHANLGQRHLQPGPGRRLPGGRLAAGRAPADRRRVGVDVLGLAPVPGLRDVPVPGVLRGVLRRRLPGAARRLVRHRPGGGPRARSATGTTRSAGRSSPGSAAPATRRPADRRAAEPCAATWPTSGRRVTARGAGPRRPARAAAPVLRARATCAAAAPSTPTGSASAGTRAGGDGRRSATAARRRSGPTRRSPRSPRGHAPAARAGRRPLGHRRHAGHETAAAPFTEGPLAVQPQRRGPRLAGLGGRARRGAAGHRPAHPGRPHRLGAALGAGAAPAARRRRPGATRWPASCSRSRPPRPGSRLNLLLTDGAGDLGHRLAPRAVGARRPTTPCSSRPNRSTPGPAGPRCPTGTWSSAAPGA